MGAAAPPALDPAPLPRRAARRRRSPPGAWPAPARCAWPVAGRRRRPGGVLFLALLPGAVAEGRPRRSAGQRLAPGRPPRGRRRGDRPARHVVLADRRAPADRRRGGLVVAAPTTPAPASMLGGRRAQRPNVVEPAAAADRPAARRAADRARPARRGQRPAASTGCPAASCWPRSTRRRCRPATVWDHVMADLRDHNTFTTDGGDVYAFDGAALPFGRVDVIESPTESLDVAVGGRLARSLPGAWYRNLSLGASHGLMVALVTYADASGDDLARGRAIAGTGTIRSDGTRRAHPRPARQGDRGARHRRRRAAVPGPARRPARRLRPRRDAAAARAHARRGDRRPRRTGPSARWCALAAGPLPTRTDRSAGDDGAVLDELVDAVLGDAPVGEGVDRCPGRRAAATG